MRNLLFGVILGLLAVVHSTPVDTVTQIPAVAEDDFFREAVTDGFLIDHLFLTSLTTESPKRNATAPASHQSSSESKDRDIIEGSGSGYTMSSVFPEHEGKQYATTTQSVSHAKSSTSTVLPRDTDDATSDSSTTQSPQSGSTFSSVPNEAQSSIIPHHNSVSQTTDPAVTSVDLSSGSGFDGSGDGSGYTILQISTTTSSNTETSTTLSTPEAPLNGKGNQRMFQPTDGSGLDLEPGTFEPISTTPANRSIQGSISEDLKVDINFVEETVKPEQQNTGDRTPGWIIIVGFIVGVAALVMLCLAIATRDKWNGPNQASQLETKTNSSNQQRELEMETFLHKDNPRENGKAAEYTVIPLDELSEKYSSL